MTIDTRDRILAEAELLFARDGFAATRLSGIAAAVGLGNAGLLHHFPSKAVVYRAVLESIADDLGGRIEAVDVAADPMDRLRQLVESLVSLHRDRPAALAVIAHEFLDRSGRIESADVLPLSGVVGHTVDAIEAGQRDGSIRSGNPLAMTAALHGSLVIGALGRSVYQATAVDPTDDAWDEELVRTALSMIADRGGAEPSPGHR